MKFDSVYKEILQRLLDRETPVAEPLPGVYRCSLFGTQFRLDLSEGFPLLTLRPVPFRCVIGELVGFIRGYTDAMQFSSLGADIWWDDANAFFKSDRFPDDRTAGYLGPIYGAQWRKTDQLNKILHELTLGERDSSRLILSSWNPDDNDKMAIPPCHTHAQFQCFEDTLHCMVNMRSSDVYLGLPFNVASYAALTHLLAAMAGLKVGELIFTLGNYHVYGNHVRKSIKLVEVEPSNETPQLTINKPSRLESVEQVHPDDFVLLNYSPTKTEGESFKAPMSSMVR